jgi:hypothetical protein
MQRPSHGVFDLAIGKNRGPSTSRLYSHIVLVIRHLAQHTMGTAQHTKNIAHNTKVRRMEVAHGIIKVMT